MELFVREGRGIFYFRFVGVDGVDGVVEEDGYLVAVFDAKADECEDTQFGIEQFAVLGCNLLVGQ